VPLIQNGVYTSPEHGIPSKANNRAMGLQLYLYHEDHSLAQNYGNGDMRFTPLAWLPGRAKPYCIEIMVQMNTPNVADGVVVLWMDGFMAYTRSNIRWGSHIHQALFSADMLVMHGGNGLPAATQHYQIGGWCVADQYIGPPKKVA
jgi:hypothetical protein